VLLVTSFPLDLLRWVIVAVIMAVIAQPALSMLRATTPPL
jgi:hypothetical protein